MRQRDVIRTIISRIWTFVPDDQRMCVRVDRDIFILNGDEDGEEFEPIFSQHGFRYVEMTFSGPGSLIAPTLDMLEAVAIRSSVAQTGAVGFDEPLMNQIQSNTLWGQADNLMMVPTDCDNRAERQGWTGGETMTLSRFPCAR